MPDGGSEQVLQSIAVPPLMGAPFTASLHTEWAHPLPGGGSMTAVNQRQIARDTNGRIYEERWLLVPKDRPYESQMNILQIADPNARTLYTCYLLVKPHRCNLETLAMTALAAYKPVDQHSGELPHHAGYLEHKNLGDRQIENIETIGTRDTTTIYINTFGNDRNFDIVREFWRSPQLRIDLLSELSDPRLGKQSFKITKIKAEDPNPRLFELPKGYEIVDLRKH
jgi:hypothetical protein